MRGVILGVLLFACTAKADDVSWDFGRRLAVAEQDIKELKDRVDKIEAKSVPSRGPAVKAAPAVVPPGHHAHTRPDGIVIVHADSNFGNPVAHAGIPYPWPKTALAGQVVPGSFQTQAVPMTWVGAGPVWASGGFAFGSGCPGGVCPTAPRQGLFGRWR